MWALEQHVQASTYKLRIEFCQHFCRYRYFDQTSYRSHAAAMPKVIELVCLIILYSCLHSQTTSSHPSNQTFALEQLDASHLLPQQMPRIFRPAHSAQSCSTPWLPYACSLAYLFSSQLCDLYFYSALPADREVFLLAPSLTFSTPEETAPAVLSLASVALSLAC